MNQRAGNEERKPKIIKFRRTHISGNSRKGGRERSQSRGARDQGASDVHLRRAGKPATMDEYLNSRERSLKARDRRGPTADSRRKGIK